MGDEADRICEDGELAELLDDAWEEFTTTCCGEIMKPLARGQDWYCKVCEAIVKFPCQNP
jgi:hypothetical protein